MKKILSIIFILLASVLLIACEPEGESNNNVNHVVSVHDVNGTLLNNFLVQDKTYFDKSLLTDLETTITEGIFLYWSEELNGQEFNFALTPVTGPLKLYPVVEELVEKEYYQITVYDINELLIDVYEIEYGEVFLEEMIQGYEAIKTHEDFLYWTFNDNNDEFRFGEPIYHNYTLRPLMEEPAGNELHFDVSLYDGYYQGVGLNELIDQSLRNSLQTRLKKDYIPKSYSSGHWATLKLADIHPSKPGYVWTIYDSKAVGVNNHGSKVGQWNKEHVVPQSWLKDHGLSGYGDDQHNLRAADMQENSRRGNRLFIDSNGSFGTTGSFYYPGDEHRGDVARILMYMLILHQGTTLTIDKMITENQWSTLIKWHLEDPVDDFEINRNQVIFEYQKNRNPFIDYPELVYAVWAERYPYPN